MQPRRERRAAGLARQRRGVEFAEDVVDRVFNPDVRHHLAADLAESRQPIGEEDEAVFVDAPLNRFVMCCKSYHIQELS